MIFYRKKNRGLSKNISDAVSISRKEASLEILSKMTVEQAYALLYFIIDKAGNDQALDPWEIEECVRMYSTFSVGLDKHKENKPGA